MMRLFITLNLLGLSLTRQVDRAVGHAHHTVRRARRDERGSVTLEQVIWAVALIVIAGGVVAVITAYVNSKSDQIK